MITYKDSGVDIQKSDRFISTIKKLVKATYNEHVVSGIGGFASLYRLNERQYLAAGTDGVGTKLKIAEQLKDYKSIGIDLVAMCANDILCTGATPLFFLDYFSTGCLNEQQGEDIVRGIIAGCQQCNMPLVGGETAEMPGVYQGEEFDLAGFALGLVEKSQLVTGENIRPGDILLGLPSSGLHSNGFSLVRKVIHARETELLRECLRPTRLYCQLILKMRQKLGSNLYKGLVHITGGGIENLCRLNKHIGFDIKHWPAPTENTRIIQTVIKRAGLLREEAWKTFNMGIGFIMILAKDKLPLVQNYLKQEKEISYVLGEVTSQPGGYQLSFNKKLFFSS